MPLKNFISLIFFIAISQVAGIIGSFFTMSEIGVWYVTLAKPDFSPPDWTFGVVWTVLYTLMGISAFLVWRKGWGRRDVKKALGVFFLQLVLNALWSIIFFGLHSVGGAFVELVILWIAIIATMVMFSRISRLAMWLLVPYIIWVTFAGYLNFSIWMLNV